MGRNTRLSLIAATTLLALYAAPAFAQKCSSFSTCAEAVKSYQSGNSKLDGDKDGIPCEKLCGKNGENMPN
jgi:hypothetical protein